MISVESHVVTPLPGTASVAQRYHRHRRRQEGRRYHRPRFWTDILQVSCTLYRSSSHGLGIL